MTGSRRRLATALFLGGATACVAGCTTVDATEDQVVIQYNSYYSSMAFSRAQSECARFGRVAELVATRAGQPSWQTAFTATNVSTFECVPPPPPAEGKTQPSPG